MFNWPIVNLFKFFLRILTKEDRQSTSNVFVFEIEVEIFVLSDLYSPLPCSDLDISKLASLSVVDLFRLVSMSLLLLRVFPIFVSLSIVALTKQLVFCVNKCDCGCQKCMLLKKFIKFRARIFLPELERCRPSFHK